MSESTSSPEKEPSLDAVAARANYEGSDSLLLFQRLSNRVIRNQVIDLLMLEEERHQQKGHDIVVNDGDGNTAVDEKGDVALRHIDYVSKTRDEVEAQLLERLRQVETDTPVNFEGEAGGSGGPDGRETMPTDTFLLDQEMNPKQKSIVEAHEKGHYLRPYHGSASEEYFARGFDFDAITYLTARDLREHRQSDPDATEEEILEDIRGYLMDGGETVERMAQLKNYFGMRGNEKFTATHLAYAREHYVQDVGFDNHMTQFFQAITPQTEKEFLRLINSSGA
jgi:hypothetical protein